MSSDVPALVDKLAAHNSCKMSPQCPCFIDNGSHIFENTLNSPLLPLSPRLYSSELRQNRRMFNELHVYSHPRHVIRGVFSVTV